MLSALFGKPETRAQATAWGVWPGDMPASGAVDVNETTAMQLLAVSGCVRYIADTISTLPVDVFRNTSGAREEVKPPRWLLDPTVDLDFTAWCSQVLTSLLLHGNSYNVITRSRAGNEIVEMVPVPPHAVSVRREKGRKVYIVNGAPFPGEIMHIKGLMLPGTDVGLSPLEYARLSIGLGLEAVTFGQDNIKDQNNMPGVLEFPNKVSPDVLKETAQAWRRARTGRRNRGLPGVLQEGAVFKPTGVTNEQAQFLQTRQWTAAEIAGQVYLVDPTELGIPVTGTSLQYGNMEQRSIATTRRAFNPWMIRIEKAITALLPQPRFMKFNLDGLLRADSEARWTVYGKASAINVMAQKLGMDPVLDTAEMRDFEDLGPPKSKFTPAPAPDAPAPLI